MFLILFWIKQYQFHSNMQQSFALHEKFTLIILFITRPIQFVKTDGIQGLQFGNQKLKTRDECLVTTVQYDTPTSSEVTSIFVDNQKFVSSIRITLLTNRSLCYQLELHC